MDSGRFRGSRSLRWGGAVALAAVVLLASVADPGSTLRTGGPFGVAGADKWIHFLAYATLAAAVASALAPRGDRHRVAAVATLVVACYGVGIELLQSMVPARSFDPADAVVNAAGAAVAAGLWWVLAGARPVRSAFDRGQSGSTGTGPADANPDAGSGDLDDDQTDE